MGKSTKSRKALAEYWRQQLAALYSEREAQRIQQYLFEDLLHGAEAELDQGQQNTMQRALDELLQGRPWQYISGWVEFYGLRLRIREGALIPRPETEELLYQALQVLPKKQELHILDMGTGSGCIALALAQHLPLAQVYALDTSPEALALAKENAELLGLQERLHWIEGDALLDAPWQKLPPLDALISNPPYILPAEAAKMSRQVLDFEPHVALFVGNGDALQFYRRMAQQAGRVLKAGGLLMAELSEFYAQETKQLWQAAGLEAVELLFDLQGKPRMLRAFCS